MNPIKGIVAVIGNYGAGKTSFALECGYTPQDIVFINDDIKEPPFVNDYKRYVDFVDMTKGLKFIDVYHKGKELIATLPESKVIIWDTFPRFESSIPIYVKSNLNSFRSPGEYSAMGMIKSGEIYNDAYRHEGEILLSLREKCDLLILTFHTKNYYQNNIAIPGKYTPGHSKAINRYADLRLWLVRGSSQDAPSGLVLKNIAKYESGKEGIKTVRIFPQKLPVCNWQSILQYYNHPVSNRDLLPEEIVTSFEAGLIEGSLTPEEKQIYLASLSRADSFDSDIEEMSSDSEKTDFIRETLSKMNGSPLPLILKAVKEFFPQTTMNDLTKQIK